MIDILIKSYNRPYYLDRCIQSIYRNVLDSNFRIVVLDDGTPKKYLEKIQDKFPEIDFMFSEFYEEKSKAILQDKILEKQKTPINMWLSAAKKASEYFVLLEDDIWFVKPFYLDKVIAQMRPNNGVFTKLFWLGNKDLIQSKKDTKKENLVEVTPNIPSFNTYWYTFVFFKFKRYKIRWFNEKLKFNTIKKRNSFYSIYSVAGVLFKKEYFITLWNNHENEVNEQLQILNALTFINAFNKKKGKLSFNRTESEVVKTGFSSSATDKSFIDSTLKMNVLNKKLNEGWFNESLDAMENFPHDFSEPYVEGILIEEGALISNSWKQWKSLFKANYEQFGCNIS